MKSTKLFYLISLLLFFFSCTHLGKKQLTLDDCPVVARKSGSLTVLDFASVKDTIDFPLSTLLSDFEVVRLENSEEAVVGLTMAYAVSETYIGMYNSMPKDYKLFDRKGKYIRSISSIGQGPDEYMSIYDSYIDEENNKIYLLTYAARKLLVFDLEGNSLQHIPFPFVVHKCRFRVDEKKRELTVTALPFSDTPLVVWQQDFDGNILHGIAAGHFVIEPGDYSNEVNASQNTSQMDFSTFYWGPIVDSLYHYHEQDNVLQPVFTTQWKDDDVIRHGYSELSDYYFVRLSFETATPTYTPPSPPQVIVDKSSLRGSFVKFKFDMLGNINGPSYSSFIRKNFIASMFPYELKDQLRKVLSNPENLTVEMKEKLIELEQSITEEDNNIMLIGKLKKVY